MSEREVRKSTKEYTERSRTKEEISKLATRSKILGKLIVKESRDVLELNEVSNPRTAEVADSNLVEESQIVSSDEEEVFLDPLGAVRTPSTTNTPALSSRNSSLSNIYFPLNCERTPDLPQVISFEVVNDC